MAAETGFQIEGDIYEVPSLDTFSMDESQVLYDYSGLLIENFVVPIDETDEELEAREKLYDNPGFMRALMHIAYQRAHPELKASKIKALIGAAKVLEALSTLSSEPVEDESLPPAQTTGPEPSSERSSVVPNTPSGSDSSTGSDGPASTLHRIGTGRSATSSPASTTATSAG